jgi:hypothetical protein
VLDRGLGPLLVAGVGAPAGGIVDGHEVVVDEKRGVCVEVGPLAAVARDHDRVAHAAASNAGMPQPSARHSER